MIYMCRYTTTRTHVRAPHTNARVRVQSLCKHATVHVHVRACQTHVKQQQIYAADAPLLLRSLILRIFAARARTAEAGRHLRMRRYLFV